MEYYSTVQTLLWIAIESSTEKHTRDRRHKQKFLTKAELRRAKNAALSGL